MEDVVEIVNAAKPGDDLELTILRGGHDQDRSTVTLGDQALDSVEGRPSESTAARSSGAAPVL